MLPTLASNLNAAQLCRANQWEAGALLIGEPRNADTIQHPPILLLTAVGDSNILARAYSWDSGTFLRESGYYLSTRNWAAMAPEEFENTQYAGPVLQHARYLAAKNAGHTLGTMTTG